MGGEGIMAASAIAILSANYIAARLDEHYPVLYTGRAGRVVLGAVRPRPDAARGSARGRGRRTRGSGLGLPILAAGIALVVYAMSRPRG